MEAFQEAADGGTRPAGRGRPFRLCRAGSFEDAAEVFVAEPLGDVVAGQDGGEQLQIVVASRIEPCRVAAVDSLRFREVGQFAMGGCRVGGMTKRLQVSLIAGEGVALIVVQIDHSFAHWTPRPVTRSILTRAFPKNFEFTGLINDGFDPQDQPKLIVHLQPVPLHAVFDPRTGFAFGLHVGHDLAREGPVQSLRPRNPSTSLGVNVSHENSSSFRNSPDSADLPVKRISVAYSA